MPNQRRNLSCLSITFLLASFWPATVVAQQVYAVSADGTIRMLADPSCEPADCRWIDLDRNARSMSLAATTEGLFQLHNNGGIWHWTGQPCSGGSCPHWQRIDRNPAAKSIAANRNNLFQLHSDGSIWRWLGRACEGSICSSWERLYGASRAIAISAGGDNLFQLHDDGAIWRWRGEPCRGGACTSWDRLDRNPRTRQIAAAAPGELYQRHSDGSIWHWKGRACAGDDCPSWERLDNNVNTQTIVAAPGALYQLHNNGGIWRWKGGACVENRCASWERLDNNRQARAMAAAEQFEASDLFPLFQVRDTGTVWRWTGQPCAGDACYWRNVSASGAFTSYGATRGGLFVFGGRAYSGSISAGLRPADFGHDTMRFARTADRMVELNVLLFMTTYANSSFNADQTAAYYENRYFGPERRLESYFNRNSRDIRFRINHAGTLRATDSRTLACAHRWSSCPGDGMIFTTATVEHLESLPTEQVRDYARFDRNRNGEITPDELFILKVEGLPDRGPDNPFDDNGGLKRTLPRCATLQGTRVRVCGDFLPIGDETNFITVAHEFAHLFGALDLYDTGNSRYTLMGATWVQDEFFVNLDPWHKMRMGLVAPRIVPIPASRSARQEVRLTHPGNYNDYEPVLFYDPARANEFFLMEFRRQRASTFDADVMGTGLVIWHVKTDARFNPVNPSSFDPSLRFGGRPAAVNVLGSPNQRFGAGPPWTNADGVISLNWPGAGDSGLRVEVRQLDANFLTFGWWRN